MKYLLKLWKCSLCYAKLCYVPIAQHDVGWLAGVQMSNISGFFRVKETLFHLTFMVSWPPPNQQEEQQGSEWCFKQKCVKNIFIKNVEVYPLFSICVYIFSFSINNRWHLLLLLTSMVLTVNEKVTLMGKRSFA